MHSLLVLAACIFFCCYVLRKELKLQPEFSPALWIPTIWMMRCATRSLEYWFAGHGMELAGQESTASVSVTGHIADQLLLVTLTILGVAALRRRRLPWNELIRDNGWLFLFFAYMAVSCLWSPAIFVSVKRFARVFGDLTMALLTMTEGRPLLALITVVRRAAIFFIPLSVLVCKYFATFGRLQSKSWDSSDMWVGLATHKNSLTAFLMLAAICLIWAMVRARNGGPPLLKLTGPRWLTMELVYLALALFLMTKSQSRSTTAIMALAFGCLLFFIFQRVGTDQRRFISTVASLIALGIVLQLACLLLAGKSFSGVILELQGKSANLTDRTEFWPILIKFGMQHPLQGAGYGGFWSRSMLDYFLSLSTFGSIPEAHNGYIEVFLNLGLIGLVFLFMIIFKAAATAWRAIPVDFEYARMRLVLLAMILLHNVAEASFQRDNNVVWLLFLMIACNVPASIREEDPSPEVPDESNNLGTPAPEAAEQIRARFAGWPV